MRWTSTAVRDVLPNGLTLLAQRDSSAPVVAVVTHVRAGYLDEPDEWVGIAHVLEHMFFKGTSARGPGALARATQALGGYLNAATGYDRTVYYAVVPSAGDGLARALELQADALMHAALDAAELGRELEVVIQEARRKLDSPPAVTGETLYQLLFQVHRMRRWRIGTEAGLRTFRASDVRAYYESRYAPPRVIVALAGDLDPGRAIALGRSAYGGWRRPAPPVPGSPPEPSGRDARLRILRADVQRPLVALGWRTVGPLHLDTPALDVAAAVLGGGRASWLGRAVRLPGLAATAGATHFTPGDVGVLEATLASDERRVADATARAVALAECLADAGPDPADLARVRALLLSAWARRLEAADGRAATLAAFEALGDYALADRYLERVQAVDAAAVREVARRYLARDAACAVVCAPPGAELALEEASWPVAERDLRPLNPPARPPRAGAAPARRRGAPVAEGVTHDALAGADVLARRRTGSGLVTVGVYLTDLTDGETSATAGVSRLLVRCALRGAGGWSAEALATAAESLGGSITVAGDADLVGWTLTVPARSAAAAAALLRVVAGDATLAEADVALECALLADDAARARDDMYRHPLQQVLARAFPGDPYGLPPLGHPELVRALEADAVRRWHARARGRRVVVALAGDRRPDDLLAAAAAFEDWPRAPAVPAAPAPAWAPGDGAEDRAKAQTALAFAFPAPGASSDGRFALIVAGTLLSGLAGRLFDELRERRALAYTVQAGPWLRRRAGAMLAYVATSPDREDEARRALLAELDRLAATPPGGEELRRARRYAAGLVAIRRQHGAAVVDELADAWIHGTIADFGQEEARREAVTAEEVHRAAAQVFRPELAATYAVRGARSDRPRTR